MPTNNGVRLHDRQRIANFREQPIETNEYQAVDGAEGELFWSSSPQNVYLLPQSPNLCLECCPRPDQIDNRPTNKPEKIPHYTTSSPDSPLPASRMRFTTGTPHRAPAPDDQGRTLQRQRRCGRRRGRSPPCAAGLEGRQEAILNDGKLRQCVLPSGVTVAPGTPAALQMTSQRLVNCEFVPAYGNSPKSTIESRMMAIKAQLTSGTVAVIFGYIRKVQPVRSSEPFRKGS
jgi:hypothetical protein